MTSFWTIVFQLQTNTHNTTKQANQVKSMAIVMSESVLNTVNQAFLSAFRQGVEAVCDIYGISREEAMMKLGIDTVTVTATKSKSAPKRTAAPKKEKPAFPLPFNGTMDDDACYGLRKEHGLYTQCPNTKKNGDYCGSCQRWADKNANGKPSSGDIRDRVSCAPMEFVDPKGNKVVSYGTVAKKLGIDRETAEREAAKFGITISEEQWVVEEKKRGRPRKSDSETSSVVTEASAAPKKRGRPRKAPTTVEVSQDELLAQLNAASAEAEEKTVEPVAVAAPPVAEDKKAEKKAAAKAAEKAVVVEESKSVTSEMSEESQWNDEEEVEIEVTKFEHNGNIYLRTDDDQLFDAETKELVGIWDETNKTIIEAEEISDDEDDE